MRVCIISREMSTFSLHHLNYAILFQQTCERYLTEETCSEIWTEERLKSKDGKHKYWQLLMESYSCSKNDRKGGRVYDWIGFYHSLDKQEKRDLVWWVNDKNEELGTPLDYYDQQMGIFSHSQTTSNLPGNTDWVPSNPYQYEQCDENELLENIQKLGIRTAQDLDNDEFTLKAPQSTHLKFVDGQLIPQEDGSH